jgi:polyisoprenoid-binding protein YceI
MTQSALSLVIFAVGLLASCGAEPAITADEASGAKTQSENSAAPAEPTEVAAAPGVRPTATSPSIWTVDYANSHVGFTATQTGQAFDGAFSRFEAKIAFDPDDLPASSVEATIDMSSAKTGDRQRDTALPERDWFDAKAYPTARFFSDDIMRTAPGTYQARGRLTIRGVTRDVVLPFALRIEGALARAEGGLTLVRTDYGVGRGEFATDEWVGLEVKVKVEILARR